MCQATKTEGMIEQKQHNIKYSRQRIHSSKLKTEAKPWQKYKENQGDDQHKSQT